MVPSFLTLTGGTTVVDGGRWGDSPRLMADTGGVTSARVGAGDGGEGLALLCRFLATVEMDSGSGWKDISSLVVVFCSPIN